MGFLTKVVSHAKSLDIEHPKKIAGWGLLAHGLEKVEHIGAAYAAGRINTQLGEKAKYRDVEITYAVGLLATIGTVAAELFLGSDLGGFAPHIDSIGTGFLAAHYAAVGARHGMEAKSSAPTAALPPKKTVVGAIPPAQQPGKFLNMDRVNSLANMAG